MKAVKKEQLIIQTVSAKQFGKDTNPTVIPHATRIN